MNVQTRMAIIKQLVNQFKHAEKKSNGKRRKYIKKERKTEP